jgi:hypothetical protein
MFWLYMTFYGYAKGNRMFPATAKMWVEADVRMFANEVGARSGMT